MSFPFIVRLLLAFGLAFLARMAQAQGTPRLSAGAQRQVDALQAEKAGRNRAQQKMDSQLIYRAKKHRGEKLGAGLETMESRIAVPADGLETVDIHCDVTPALEADLKAAGGRIIASVPRFHAIRVRLPLAAIEGFAGRADVRFVKPAVRVMTHVGAYTSQGDVTMRADAFRSTLKATGRGIKVGVLSDSIYHLFGSQTTGDLGPVTVLPGQDGITSDSTGEGTAMLEIVHDLAPDAELYFASAFISEAQFAQNILDLRAAGCDIIIDDVGYFDESPFQDGPVAQAVDQVADDGALYFSAAGNEGNQTNGTSGVWEGDFADGGPSGPLFTKAGRLHSFGSQTYNTLMANGSGATLFWSDPAGASDNDYDLYLLDSTGTQILAASTNTQNGHQDPYEAVGTIAGGRLVIVKSVGAQPRHLHLNTLRGELQFTTLGTIQGHPAAAGALAVAAVDANSAYPNPFSAINEGTTEDTAVKAWDAILAALKPVPGEGHDNAIRHFPPAWRAAYTTFLLQCEVDNGGHHQFFWNTEGEWNAETQADLETIDAWPFVRIFAGAARFTTRATTPARRFPPATLGRVLPKPTTRNPWRSSTTNSTESRNRLRHFSASIFVLTPIYSPNEFA